MEKEETKVNLLCWTYGPEWGKEAEGVTVKLIHNPIYDGPIDNYRGNTFYTIEEILTS